MKRGFTLIEILVVVAIISILASVVLVGLGPTQQSGRDARRLSDLREVQNALELYFSKCGYYPGPTVSGSCGSTPWSQTSKWADLTAAITGSNIGVSTVPNDPSAGHTYYYGTPSGGASYILAATLENSNNSVFTTYQAPSITGYTFSDSGFVSCAAPTYCITL
jgi:prepilin-type N-terminal cleavage/methylation domain-containing protein